MSKKVGIITGLAVIILVFLGIMIGRNMLNDRLDKFLKDELEMQLGPDYDIDYEESKLELIGNQISISNLVFEKRGKEQKDVAIRIDKLNFYGFRPLSFLFKGSFGVDSITLIEPVIALKTLKFGKPDSLQSKADTISVDEKRRKLEIGCIRSTDGRLQYDADGPEELSCTFNFAINDIEYQNELVDIESLWSKSELYFNDLHYLFADSVQIIDVERMVLQKDETDIQLKNLHYHSTLSKTEYPAHYGWRKSRFDVMVGNLSIARPQNVSDSLLVISRMELDSVDFEIHKDARWPWPDRVTNLPQEFIAKIPKQLNIDSVIIKRSRFVFAGVFGDNAAPIKVFFNDINGSLAGFQNTDMTKPAFTLNARSSFMDKAPMEAMIQYSYGADDPFKCTASIGQTNLFFMSDFMQKIAGIRVESGQVERLNLVMEGNKHGAGGHVDFYYKDLEILAVDKETGEKAWFKNILTDVLSGIVFWKENTKGEKFRRGVYYKERTLYKGFASQWIDGLFEGILQSVSKIDPARVKKSSKKKGKQ